MSRLREGGSPGTLLRSVRIGFARAWSRAVARILPGSAADPSSAEEARLRLSTIVAIAAAERGRSAPDGDGPRLQVAPERVVAQGMTDVVLLRRSGEPATYATPSFARLFGTGSDATVLRGRVHPDDLAAFDAADAAVEATGRSVVLAVRMRHADGHWIWVEAVNDPVADGVAEGGPTILSCLRDVTERRNQSDEWRMARDAAELGRARAENTTRAKSEFIGLMSHEIRTPLTAIRGFIDLLTDGGPLEPQQRRHLALVEAATETLLVAVDDILDYAKSETGDLRIERRSFAPVAVIAGVVDLVRPAAEGKGLILDTSFGHDLPAQVTGDERRLRQILLNLLNDAVGVAQAGAIRLSVLGPRLGQGADVLRIAIVATVPDQTNVTVLPRAALIDGGGLGLAMAQRLIGLMGGRLDRTTRPGEAAAYRFSVVLPASLEAEPAPAAMEVALTRPTRVLLAEDGAIDQEVVRAMLERSGCVVDVVGDGLAAVEAVQARTYDLVLMDMVMPVMDGLTAARRIRALQHPSRRVPILALTADVMPQRVRAFTEAGINDHLAKPFDRASLAEAVARQLSAFVLLDAGEGGQRPSRPAVFERACYDSLRSELGLAAAQGTLRAFMSLLETAGDAASSAREAQTIAVAAARLGFLDLANAYGRLAAAAEGPESTAAQRRCSIARDLARRTFGELTSLQSPDVSSTVALL
ncbi:response regulator [Methylobacterium sp. Leaf108]|uniref:response regulator n=1 Tax=Methylobacterium sp. Leaf108 TaxID=1736256 RepID=UPI0006F6F0AC|nr:response regulator [Methylobacterium sp. Leaf108]KQP54942.1 hypothetical protein ASF39_04130 [Methylobacterium sp. Leaf108]